MTIIYCNNHNNNELTHLVEDRTLNVTVSVMVQTWSASLVSDKCQYELV